MVGRLFPNCRFKNAVFAPTNRDYIGGENRLDSHSGDTRIRMKIGSIIHTTCIRNLGTGLELHMCSKMYLVAVVIL